MLDLASTHSMPHATSFEPLEPTVLLDRPYKPINSLGTMNTTSMRPSHYWGESRAADIRHDAHPYPAHDLGGGPAHSDWALEAGSHASRADSRVHLNKPSHHGQSLDDASADDDEVHSPTADAKLPADLKVPSNLDTPQISIATLAAEVTCLFWFEHGNTLKQIENTTAAPSTPINHVPDARPTPNFNKRISTLLAMTQVKPNVVLLALLFIYRLKCANPSVKGKPGSEYRLLTVALMLGNKFLDDNTYTNKTWADVSAISAQEVQIMEVEFLSNMRYTLYVSDVQWKKWYISLGKFGTYISNCLRHWDNQALHSATLNPLAGLQNPVFIPSPPVSSNGSPCTLTYTSNNFGRTSSLLNSQLSTPGAGQSSAVVQKGKKRSYDDTPQEPAAKRHSSMYLMQLPQPSTMARNQPVVQGSMAPIHQAPLYPHALMPPNMGSQLPFPGTRAMATVYPTPRYPTSQPINAAPLHTNILPQPNMVRLDPSRGISPYPLEPAAASPLSASVSQVTTPCTRLSPSFYLAQRSSPYKPVRRPYTLLAPPPPIAYHNPARQVSDEQMQYHSLGRPMGERQHGHIPYNPQPHQYYSPLPPLGPGSSLRQ